MFHLASQTQLATIYLELLAANATQEELRTRRQGMFFALRCAPARNVMVAHKQACCVASPVHRQNTH